MADEGNGDLPPEESFGTGTPPDLPSVTLLKEIGGIPYYDYVGRVEVRQAKAGLDILGNYVVIVDRKTGKKLCEIDSKHENEFFPYEGKVIRFRGKLNKYHGLVTPHTE